MDLTFQVPMQYWSLHYQIFLLSPITSTTECCFCSGSIPSFLLELFLYWSPVAYWAPTDLGSSSFSVLSLCFFILFMGFSRQEYWSGLPFLSPVGHILSDFSTMTQWPHMAWFSFTELDKAVIYVIRLACFLWYWFVCLLSDAFCQCLPSYLGFSHLGHDVSLISCSSKVHPWSWAWILGNSSRLLLLTLDVG